MLCGMCRAEAAPDPPSGPAIFDSNPNHIWNRIHGCLWMRPSAYGAEYGADALDPPLWHETKWLLAGDSHRAALACLDEFLRVHAERAVQDPLKRAIMQRDLWAIFDWAAADGDPPRQRRELEARLAEAIRRVALTADEIRALPDTYAAALAAKRFAPAYDPRNPAQPFLPPELFHSDGGWICLSAFSERPTAIVHFSGRSRFLLFMRLPGGRDATLAYVTKLRSWPTPPVIVGDTGAPLLNLALPQFPAGTEVALVRQAIAIDADGKLVPTALTESVQLRVYRAITPGTQYINYINGPSSHDQDFFEFRMSRPELFAQHGGGLVAVRSGETEYATFSTHGRDPFESAKTERQGVILERCLGCHADSGIHSVQSRTQWMRPSQASRDAIDWETAVTIAHKQRQPEFRLLQELWRGNRE